MDDDTVDVHLDHQCISMREGSLREVLISESDGLLLLSLILGETGHLPHVELAVPSLPIRLSVAPIRSTIDEVDGLLLPLPSLLLRLFLLLVCDALELILLRARGGWPGAISLPLHILGAPLLLFPRPLHELPKVAPLDEFFDLPLHDQAFVYVMAILSVEATILALVYVGEIFMHSLGNCMIPISSAWSRITLTGWVSGVKCYRGTKRGSLGRSYTLFLVFGCVAPTPWLVG